ASGPGEKGRSRRRTAARLAKEMREGGNPAGGSYQTVPSVADGGRRETSAAAVGNDPDHGRWQSRPGFGSDAGDSGRVRGAMVVGTVFDAVARCAAALLWGQSSWSSSRASWTV